MDHVTNWKPVTKVEMKKYKRSGLDRKEHACLIGVEPPMIISLILKEDRHQLLCEIGALVLENLQLVDFHARKITHLLEHLLARVTVHGSLELLGRLGVQLESVLKIPSRIRTAHRGRESKT